jgi:predicted ribosome quality control (RQC) complex YloA/Tae2 family protein
MKQTFTFWIGQNAQDNFEIIDKADPEYFWFHVHDSSSAHIIVSIPETVDKKEQRYVIKKGAELAKQHSSKKSEKNVSIVYTKIKNVSKTDTIGTVHIINPKYITI